MGRSTLIAGLTINGAVATLGARVGAGDELRLDGRAVHAHAPAGVRAFLCHRSPGEPLGEPIGAAAPAPGERTAMLGRLPRRLGRRFIAVSPMPRPDGGLELVTSDGELAAQLQRGVHAFSSEFGVRVRGELSDTQLQGILGGALDSGLWSQFFAGNRLGRHRPERSRRLRGLPLSQRLDAGMAREVAETGDAVDPRRR